MADVAQTLPTESASKLWRGLTDSEAQKRLRQFDPNALPVAHKATLFSITFATLKEPMLVLLLSTGVVYLLIGDLREAIAILASISLVIGISVVQKTKNRARPGGAPRPHQSARTCGQSGMHSADSSS